MTKNTLMIQLHGLARIFDQVVDAQLTAIWLTVLGELSDEELVAAVKLYCIDAESKFFPKPGQIYRLARPEFDTKEEAAIIADNIFAALRAYGTDSVGTERARLKIGEIGWNWIANSGGWDTFVNRGIEEEQVPVLQSQCRLAILGFLFKRKYDKESLQNETKVRSLKDFGLTIKSIDIKSEDSRACST
jgi:hypothetical protein